MSRSVGYSPLQPAARPAGSDGWRLDLKVEDPSLLRGMPVADLLRNFSRVMSNNESSAKDYELSTPVTQVGTFVSHTWSTPRWTKFGALCFHFNRLPAMLVSVLVAVLACGLTTQGFLPTVRVRVTLDDADVGVVAERGICCFPIGLAAFFVTFFLMHELDKGRILRKRHTVFLDKTCVHQTDMQLKRKGIEGLAAILNDSDEMLVLYSEQYITRLWTVYEVASWLTLHPGKKMIARPVFMPFAMILSTIFVAASDVAILVMEIAGVDVFKGSGSEAMAFACSVVTLFPCMWALAWLSVWWAEKLQRIWKHLAGFTLAGASCSEESDRSVVQRNIVALMRHAGHAGADASDAEVIEIFERLVREEVPRLMWSSFSRVGFPYDVIVVCSLPDILVIFDYAAGWMLEAKPARYIFLRASSGVASSLGVSPMLAAMFLILCRYPSCWGFWGKAGIGLAGTIMNILARSLLAGLVSSAEFSNTWLAVLASVYAAMVVTTFFVFRPL